MLFVRSVSSMSYVHCLLIYVQTEATLLSFLILLHKRMVRGTELNNQGKNSKFFLRREVQMVRRK